MIDQLMSFVETFSEEELYHTVNQVLECIAARNHPSVSIPHDFVELSFKSMERLKQLGRVYGLIRGLGISREDETDSQLPVLRMPMGLLEYVISFYSEKTINK